MNENKKCEIVTQEILSKMEVKTLSLLESEKGEIPNRIDFVCRIIYKTGKPDLIVGTPLHLEYKGHLEIIDDSFAKMLYLTCGEEPRRMIN